MTASRFDAWRRPSVPTAAIARAPSRFASSTMPAIATIARSSGSGWIAPPAARPSPSRVTSARSTTGCGRPSASNDPTWNLIEFVPRSMTA